MQIIGHRGAKGLAPENTIAGIAFALARKVDWIEFDVRATKDNKVVVIHDATLMRISKERGRVRDYTYAELHRLATWSGEPIPTFEEVMKAIGKKAKVDIELKEKGCSAKVIEIINQQVLAGRSYSDFIVSSFKPWLLKEMKSQEPRIPRLLLQGGVPFLFLLFPGLQLSGVGFSRFAAPRQAISMAKKRGLWTIAFTINSKAEAALFKAKGIDAIATDVPQAFISAWPIVIRWGLGLVCLAVALLLLCYVVRL